MILVHKHIIIRAEVKKPIINKSKGRKFLTKLIKTINMKPLYGPVACYCKMEGNKGLTAFAIIETSHIAMHIWDEPNPALVQLDVYTCGPFNPQEVLDVLNVMEPVKVDYKYLDRENNFKELEI